MMITKYMWYFSTIIHILFSEIRLKSMIKSIKLIRIEGVLPGIGDIPS